MNYCDQCGSKLSAGDLFCTECGYRTSQNQPEKIVEDLQENKPADSAGPVLQNAFPAQKTPKPGRKRKKPVVILVLIILGVIGTCVIFGEQIGTQVSYIINPGITVTFKAQIPEGETAQQITENMNSIAYITKIRLINLGYSKATVSVDHNTLTVKHIPKKADINDVTDYITSFSYTAEIQDADGNTILNNAEFSTAFVVAGVDANTQYDISIFLTTEGDQLLEAAIKPFAAQETGKNYIVLIANDKKISDLHISSETAQSGLESGMLSFIVPEDSPIDLTLQELSKALNSCGELPYALK